MGWAANGASPGRPEAIFSQLFREEKAREVRRQVLDFQFAEFVRFIPCASRVAVKTPLPAWVWGNNLQNHAFFSLFALTTSLNRLRIRGLSRRSIVKKAAGVWLESNLSIGLYPINSTTYAVWL